MPRGRGGRGIPAYRPARSTRFRPLRLATYSAESACAGRVAELLGLGAGSHAERCAERPGRPCQSQEMVPSFSRIRSAIRRRARGPVRQPDGELLTPDAGGHIPGADLFPDDPGKVNQRRIPAG